VVVYLSSQKQSVSEAERGHLSVAPSRLKDLSLAYSEYLGPAVWAYTLRCRSLILHRYRLWVLDLHLFPALQTVGLHLTPLRLILRPQSIT